MVKTVLLRRLSFSLLIATLLSVCFGFTGIGTPPSAHAASNASSFMNTRGVQWPDNQALPRFSMPHHLDVVNLENGPGDVSLLLSTLEGIVNRTQPRIYLLEHNHDEGPYTWLNDSHIPYQVHQDPWEIVNKYYHEAKGIIIYDPNLLDSIDVATTLAGLKDGLVVSPTLAQTLTVAPYHMPVLDDLRGKFSSALDAYTWEFQNLWPQTTHRMLIGLVPTTSIEVPSDNWKDFQTVLQESRQLTDGSNQQTYTIDLSNFLGGDGVYLRFQDAFSNDGWGPSVHQATVKADGNIIAQFTGCSQQEEQYIFDHGGSSCDLSQTNAHRFADGKSYFVYHFVPPAGTKQLTVSVDMWNQFLVSASKVTPAASSDQQVPFGYLRDYAVANHAFVFWLTANTDPNQVALFNKILAAVKPGTPYLGWFDNEPAGVAMASQHGVYVLAADWFSNLTVWSGVPAPPHKIKPIAAPPLQNKIYVTFVVSDGDNLQYDEHYMRMLWSNPDRGKVPLNWSISPLLIDAAPFFLNYYQRTATPNDLLIAAPSGAGYFYPSQWPQKDLPLYLQQSNKYLRAMGTNIIYALDSSPTMPASVGKAYAQTQLNGMFYNNYNQSTTSIVNGNLPVSTQMNVGSNDAVINAIQQQAANWDGNSPLFITVSLVAWNTTPTDAVYIAQHLDNSYAVVRGDQYFQLVREAYNLPPVKQ
ncbi:GxGYxYP domain-containing protein [Ktedonospora formicarum]|uniref:GxGYxY sequence motif-containing protein n=1 Tax=Ktedonospora formicarum TaxID=2778364 RepID=A0A8J3I7X4_9CHLR|nr:GxGYxYP domain-containing protein [Ktedonospora formicarum]GHO47692.1 hypothetical protein KSX_58550 [Ktedonospora formicarum]